MVNVYKYSVSPLKLCEETVVILYKNSKILGEFEVIFESFNI